MSISKYTLQKLIDERLVTISSNLIIVEYPINSAQEKGYQIHNEEYKPPLTGWTD